MSTGILTTRAADSGLRSRRGRAVVERARDEKEEPDHAGDESDDAENQAYQSERSAAEGAAARADALPRYETHDRRRRSQHDAEARDRAHERRDPEHERSDGEAVGALSGVAGVAARRHR